MTFLIFGVSALLWLASGMWAARLTYISMESRHAKMYVIYDQRDAIHKMYHDDPGVVFEPDAEEKFYMVMALLFGPAWLAGHGVAGLTNLVMRKPTPRQRRVEAEQKQEELMKLVEEYEEAERQRLTIPIDPSELKSEIKSWQEPQINKIWRKSL